MALTPAAVKSTLLTSIAHAALAGTFASGAGIGMRKKTVLTEDPIEVEMNSDNPWQDASKFTIPVDGLQNDFGTLATMHGYAEAGCQIYGRTASGLWLAFTGADLDSETAMGCDWQYSFNLKDDLTLKTIFTTEVSRATAKGLYTEVDPVGVTWDSGEDSTKRLRPGIKKITIGGTHLGELREVTGVVKNRASMGRLGRPLSIGVDVEITAVGTQMDETDLDNIHDQVANKNTIIYEWWNTQTLKLTNVFGGRRAKIDLALDGTWTFSVKYFFPDSADTVLINDTPGEFELVNLDNAAEA